MLKATGLGSYGHCGNIDNWVQCGNCRSCKICEICILSERGLDYQEWKMLTMLQNTQNVPSYTSVKNMHVSFPFSANFESQV